MNLNNKKIKRNVSIEPEIQKMCHGHNKKI